MNTGSVTPDGWTLATVDKPCPICGQVDGCHYQSIGQTFWVVCMNDASGPKNGVGEGFVHFAPLLKTGHIQFLKSSKRNRERYKE